MLKGIALLITLFATFTSISHSYGQNLGLRITLGNTSSRDFIHKISPSNDIQKKVLRHGSLYSKSFRHGFFGKYRLQSIKGLFNSRNTLIALEVSLPQNEFSEWSKRLSEKYELVGKQIPFVGDRGIAFKNKDHYILVHAPTSSFSMTIRYIDKKLLNKNNTLDHQSTSLYFSDSQ